MKNIFKDAKFRDKFVTKSGQVAIYQRYVKEPMYDELNNFEGYSVAHILFTEDKELMCSDDGTAMNYTVNDSIEKRYVEPIQDNELFEKKRKEFLKDYKSADNSWFQGLSHGFYMGWRSREDLL